ncbi:MAG: hypothetical protein D6753_01720 [Planctomycetota bacterium]|nr:MAG: hypothetical protein D6753_01720 [Planctomycetota bacterium]
MVVGWWAVCLVGVAACLPGCALVPDIRRKPQVINPFPQIKTVAILPFANQSEEPTLSGERVALAYLNEVQAIRGFEVVPLGAVKIKLTEFGRPLRNGADFQQFAQFLGVDAVLVGAVTDYDPYYPPRMALKVSWYAANPGFHPIPPGYGIPWGTNEERKIPRWVHYEAQRALAAEQLKTQTPRFDAATETTDPMPADPAVTTASAGTEVWGELDEWLGRSGGDDTSVLTTEEAAPSYQDVASSLPPDWPDPGGFIPDGPSPTPPPMRPQHGPIISHMRSFNGHDEDFTEQLAEYFYYRDDERFGGWQSYLQRSEDFIRFCCYLHLHETLIARGGRDKSRLILRWPIDRYVR